VASTVPDLIQIASTSISGTAVEISWVEPFANYKPILEYDIIFITQSGSYINIYPECDGQDPDQTACSIEMQRLRDLTGLQENDLIVVRVRARNENGWDAFSQQNVQGARIEVEPHEPTGLTFDIATSDKSQVSLSW
jgi:hypothetical protein